MDKKALQLLREYHQIFSDNLFVERDVLGFLIFIRELLPVGSKLKELSHFIAHRNRNQGITQSFAEKIEDLLKSKTSKFLDTAFPDENVLFPGESIKQELTDFFNNYDLSELSGSAVAEILLCLMCILQLVSIYKSDETKFAELKMAIFTDRVVLYAQINWKISASTVKCGVPIMGLECTHDDFPKDVAGIDGDIPFSTIRVDGKLMIRHQHTKGAAHDHLN